MTSWLAGHDVEGVVLGVIGMLLAAFAAWRKFSGDRLVVTRNNAEGGWIGRLQSERDSALERERATWALHLKDREDIASLTMKNAFMVEQLERVERQLSLIKRLLVEARPDIADLLSSEFSDLTN